MQLVSGSYSTSMSVSAALCEVSITDPRLEGATASLRSVLEQLQDELAFLHRLSAPDSLGTIFHEIACQEFRNIESSERNSYEAVNGLYERARALQKTISEVQGYTEDINDIEVAVEGLCELMSQNSRVLVECGTTFLQRSQEMKDECRILSLLQWETELASIVARYIHFFDLYGPNVVPHLKIDLSSRCFEDRPRFVRQMTALEQTRTLLQKGPVVDAFTRILAASQKDRILHAFQLCYNQRIEAPATENRQSALKAYLVETDGVLIGMGTHKCVARVGLQALYPTTRLHKDRALVKLLLPTRRDLNDLVWESEISKILRRGGTPYILKVKQIMYSTADGQRNVGALCEYCTKGSLHTFLKRVNDPKTLAMLSLQLCQSIQGLQREGYCHLDLKSTNIYVTEKTKDHLEIRLGDLSTVKKVGLRVNHFCSTYPAPEMHMNRNEYVVVRPSMDLWALGDVLLQMKRKVSVLDEQKITHQTDYKRFESLALQVGQSVAHRLGATCDPWDQMIIRLFSFSPEGRPSIEEVCATFEQWVRLM